MDDYRKSSSAAEQSTGSGVDGPTLHDPKGDGPTLRVVEAVSDDVSIDTLAVSEEMKTTLRQAMKHPNFITISYLGRDGQIKTWWQTRRFPNDVIDRTIDHLRSNVFQQLGGAPVSQQLRDQLAQRKKPLPR